MPKNPVLRARARNKRTGAIKHVGGGVFVQSGNRKVKKSIRKKFI